MESVLEEFIVVRKQLRDLIVQFPKDKTDLNLFSGDRNLKDIVAHITAWDALSPNRLSAIAVGRSPSWVEDIDIFNQQAFYTARNQSWGEVLTEFDKVGKDLIESYQCLSPKFWEKKFWPNRRFTPRNDLQGSISHMRDEHIKEIELLLNTIKR